MPLTCAHVTRYVRITMPDKTIKHFYLNHSNVRMVQPCQCTHTVYTYFYLCIYM